MKFISTLILVLYLYHGIHCEEEVPVNETLKKPEPLYEYLRFCGHFCAKNQQYEITEVRLDWGKWTRVNDHSTEVSSPYGQRFGNGTTQCLWICSAGRSGAIAGTKGYVIIQPQHSNDKIQFNWNIPVTGTSEHYFSRVDRTKYDITDRAMNSAGDYREYVITQRKKRKP